MSSILKEYIKNINESIRKLKKIKRHYKKEIKKEKLYDTIGESDSNPSWFPQWVKMTEQEKNCYLDEELNQIRK